jgi:hypothetical protein
MELISYTNGGFICGNCNCVIFLRTVTTTTAATTTTKATSSLICRHNNPLQVFASSMALLQRLERFHDSKFFQGGVVSPHTQLPTFRTRDYTSSGLYPLTHLAWVALPEVYAPASTANFNYRYEFFISEVLPMCCTYHSECVDAYYYKARLQNLHGKETECISIMVK